MLNITKGGTDSILFLLLHIRVSYYTVDNTHFNKYQSKRPPTISFITKKNFYLYSGLDIYCSPHSCLLPAKALIGISTYFITGFKDISIVILFSIYDIPVATFP